MTTASVIDTLQVALTDVTVKMRPSLNVKNVESVVENVMSVIAITVVIMNVLLPEGIVIVRVNLIVLIVLTGMILSLLLWLRCLVKRKRGIGRGGIGLWLMKGVKWVELVLCLT